MHSNPPLLVAFQAKEEYHKRINSLYIQDTWELPHACVTTLFCQVCHRAAPKPTPQIGKGLVFLPSLLAFLPFSVFFRTAVANEVTPVTRSVSERSARGRGRAGLRP